MIKAKKEFGQNFLKDQALLHKIIESIPKKNRVVVEIGAGLGDLTEKLIQHFEVVAFEIDNSLCKILKKRFHKEIEDKRLTLICADVTRLWQENLIDKEYDLVANLPYYIATKLILKALEDDRCKSISVMVQKEVAQKFCATSGSKEFSSLAILASLNAVARLLFDIPPQAFEPPPKVTSSFFRIEKRKDFQLAKLEFEKFKEFLRVAFLSPRKMLIKNLSSKYDKKKIEHIFDKLQIARNSRAHEIPTSLYRLIFNEIGRTDGTKDKR